MTGLGLTLVVILSQSCRPSSVTQIAGKDQSPGRHKFGGPRVPPNLFGIALGMAGLAQAWHAAVPVLGTVQAVPGALDVLAAALWLVLAGGPWFNGPVESLIPMSGEVAQDRATSAGSAPRWLGASAASAAPTRQGESLF